MDALPLSPHPVVGIAHSPTFESPSISKRPRLQTDLDEHPPKKIKVAPEEPALYSENVRRKLASATRTGQACDRCKERKMKCDPDPVACQPCRQKSLKCYTTDRVTGHSRERGQSDRAENEVQYLRDQVSQYQRRYGPVAPDVPPTPFSAFPSPARDRQATLAPLRPEIDSKFGNLPDIPSSTYVGWPTPDTYGLLQKGPVEGTRADMLEWGFIDSGDFQCDIMREPRPNDTNFFNFSSGSVSMTINQKQKIHDPMLPMKAETLQHAENFLAVMWGFVPVVHKPSFFDLIHRLYDAPDLVPLAEKVQVVEMMAILNHQIAIRNHAQASKIEDSYRFLHWSLGHYLHLLQDPSLAAMQALAMILVHFRNLPKPGLTWSLAQQLLIKAIDQDYHRDPDRIALPPGEDNVLAKELRKRVFHSILGICVATGCRLGRPAPWQFIQWDVPLPMAIKDSEISVNGLEPERSGKCDFWQCLHLAKLLPLYTELNRYILSVRRSSLDYLKIIDALKNKVDAWRAEWDRCVAIEDSNDTQIIVATLLVDSWAAEFLLNLHHPSVCTSRASEVMDRNLDACHKAAKRMLLNFHTLSKRYKAADFTWHCTVEYALGFGTTLHIYKKRARQLSQEQFTAMKNELAGWMTLMAYADLVLRTNNHLQKWFDPLVREVQALGMEHLSGRASLNSNGNSASFTHLNPMQGIKTETSPLPPPKLDFSHEGPGFESYHGSKLNGLVPGSHAQPLPPYPASFLTTQSSLPPTMHSFSPSSTLFPPLPVSLAPLLNKSLPGDVTQLQNGSSTMQQEVSMIFQPELYTDNTQNWMWPIQE